MIVHSVIQSSTRLLLKYYFVYRYLNNAWYNQAHSLIGKPYLAIIASNAHGFLHTMSPEKNLNLQFVIFVDVSRKVLVIQSQLKTLFRREVEKWSQKWSAIICAGN